MASSLALAGCGEAGGEASVSAEPSAVESQSLELGTTTERRIIVYRTELQQLYTVDKKGNPLLVAERSGPPVVSPDGRKVAYSKLPDSWNEGDPMVSAELYVLDKSGRSHALTRGYDDTEPVWTPNGESLLFQSTLRTGIPSLWRAQISGSHVVQVTNESTVSDSPAYIPNPASSTTVQWGPTERRIIVYSTARTTNGDVRVIDFDQTLAVKKSYSLGKGYAPQWTDHGTIVFAQDTDGQVSYVEASLE